MRLHAIVEDLETARAAVEGGATVVQLRLKGARRNKVTGKYESTEAGGILDDVNMPAEGDEPQSS